MRTARLNRYTQKRDLGEKMNNKTKVAAETAFAEKSYKRRATLNRKAQTILAGSRPVTIRLDNSEIALAKQQAEAKGLKYQTYMKMLLHESLHAAGPLGSGAERAQRRQP
jgi:predicted DNA binding CopG/RHH family protein